MAKLILSMDGLVLKEIQLNKERLSIGRKPHNDIQIDNLAISGEHAVIVTILDDSFLEDLNSTNGTQVNGQPIKKHVLRHNDVIELGKYKLKYMNDQQRVAENVPLESAQSVAATAVPEKPVGEAAIQLLNGGNAGKTLALTKTLTTLGKPGVQVAVIARRPTGYFVTHVEGSKFPSLNGVMLDAQAHQLKDHDIVEIAGIKMEFFLKS
jgi:pSer/pThr/pTyr-binding forkhead associated (FHA) protein